MSDQTGGASGVGTLFCRPTSFPSQYQYMHSRVGAVVSLLFGRQHQRHQRPWFCSEVIRCNLSLSSGYSSLACSQGSDNLFVRLWPQIKKEASDISPSIHPLAAESTAHLCLVIVNQCDHAVTQTSTISFSSRIKRKYSS